VSPSPLAVDALVAAHRADAPIEPTKRATEATPITRNWEADWLAAALALALHPIEFEAVTVINVGAFEAFEADRAEMPSMILTITIPTTVHDDEALALRLGEGLFAPIALIRPRYGSVKFLRQNFAVP
jgi:hypothetical protein